MPYRLQRTIARPAEVTGIGFLTGADVTLRFLPAEENHGIVFRRVDRPGMPSVPATIDYTLPRERRTAVARGDAVVEMTEHVLASLAGLQVDNCLVELNAPEPPGCDGSALPFVDALLTADFHQQTSARRIVRVETPTSAVDSDNQSEITAKPIAKPALVVNYQLDYGPQSPIPPQSLALEITPQTFREELAFARTFILESEVAALKAQGYGTRVTPKDLLVFSEQGIIDNRLRINDECVRHKMLDCLGDFALLGSDVHGFFAATRSGHQLNREIVRRMCDRKHSLGSFPHSRAA